jgi:UDP-N-acetylmuramate dehydrogenase
MGNGSNLIFDDEGFEGVVIRIGGGLDRVHIEGPMVFAEAGALIWNVARAVSLAGLAGLEFACGIPGSAGGAVYMNAGAYGEEMKEIVCSVSSVGLGGMMKDRPGKELAFTYRSSIFQENRETILGVKLLLRQGDPAAIQEKIRDFTERRTTRQPLQYPSSGSFFRRPPGHFAGKLIQEAGLMGLSCGGAQVSDLHAGFIINRGDASTADILDLMRIVQETVLSRTGVLLEPEVRILGKDGQIKQFL